MISATGINTAHISFFRLFNIKDRKMLKVTLSDYSVIYVKTVGEALEKAFKLGQNIRFID